MYKIKKTMEIAVAHKLDLSYDSKCQALHGHNLIITVYCQTEKLNENGMVIDFTEIKKQIHDYLDHQYINRLVDFNPTAENLSRWICETITNCYKVEIQESQGNVASYEV